MDHQPWPVTGYVGVYNAVGVLVALTATLCMTTGCGGSSSASAAPDFSLTLSPASVSAQVGTTTAPVSIAVNGQPGFSGSVSVSLQGVPRGVTVSPSSSFAVAAGAGQPVTFDLPASTAVGPVVITVSATGGGHSHSAQITVTAASIVRTYQSGTRLYLESGNSVDTARIGLETMWGGSIVELSINGTEYVNRHDTGREVQPAFRSGNDVNWNPTLAGDGYDHGTPLISQSLAADSIYVMAQPLQWLPDFFGGGQTQPIAGDMLVEQRVSAVTTSANTFKVHYKVTHLGNDTHGTGGQEFPAVYTNRDYVHFVYYDGANPWTNGVLKKTQFPNLGQPNPPVTVLEHWGALVDSNNAGLTVFSPSSGPLYIGFVAQDPNQPGGGPQDNSTNYFAPLPNWTITPGFVQEADIYLIAGDYQAARSIVYQLHPSVSAPDISAPFQNLDQPAPGATLSGVVSVSGWAFDDVMVAKVEVLMDGVADGVADYGQSRPDVAQAYPNLTPVNVGFSYSLSTTKFSNGPHVLTIRATDTSNNVAISPGVAVTVAN
ncbi:MAG TPA: Ig-like domain-containing protein [Terriglobales bacterium]|nr:Ig-like domain-containing protein [Terriglobales bacterium]